MTVGGESGGHLTGGIGRTLGALALSPFARQRFANLINKERASDLERLTGLIDAGQVPPSVDQAFPLDHVSEVMRQLAEGHVRSKAVVVI